MPSLTPFRKIANKVLMIYFLPEHLGTGFEDEQQTLQFSRILCRDRRKLCSATKHNCASSQLRYLKRSILSVNTEDSCS